LSQSYSIFHKIGFFSHGVYHLLFAVTLLDEFCQYEKTQKALKEKKVIRVTEKLGMPMGLLCFFSNDEPLAPEIFPCLLGCQRG
jgi:hypothetical protein